MRREERNKRVKDDEETKGKVGHGRTSVEKATRIVKL